MLAVKLHSKKDVNLGAGTFLIPIFRWDSGQVFIRRWIERLNKTANPKVTRVRFVTLVTVPDDHPVALYLTAVGKNLTEHDFRPLSAIPDEERRQLAEWYDRFAAASQETASLNQPELVLGEPLPAKHIKWTKRTQLLYDTSTNKSKRRKQQ
jgi:hypothetical protein